MNREIEDLNKSFFGEEPLKDEELESDLKDFNPELMNEESIIALNKKLIKGRGSKKGKTKKKVENNIQEDRREKEENKDLEVEQKPEDSPAKKEIGSGGKEFLKEEDFDMTGLSPDQLKQQQMIYEENPELKMLEEEQQESPQVEEPEIFGEIEDLNQFIQGLKTEEEK